MIYKDTGKSYNADGGTRTRTMSPSADFESAASAIPPHPQTSDIIAYYITLSQVVSSYVSSYYKEL